jgi:hypothetical protein
MITDFSEHSLNLRDARSANIKALELTLGARSDCVQPRPTRMARTLEPIMFWARSFRISHGNYSLQIQSRLTLVRFLKSFKKLLDRSEGTE